MRTCGVLGLVKWGQQKAEALIFCGCDCGFAAIHEKKAEVLDIGEQYFKSVMLDMKAGQVVPPLKALYLI